MPEPRSSTRAWRGWSARAKKGRSPEAPSLAGRSWSEEGVQDAAKLLGWLLELNMSVSGPHCSKGGMVGESEKGLERERVNMFLQHR